MRRLSTLKVLSALLVIFLVAGFAQAQYITTLSGTVTLKADNSPVAGYTMLLNFKGEQLGIPITTDDKGFYFTSVFVDTTYTLTAVDTFVYEPMTVDVPVGTDPVTLDIQVAMRTDLNTVTGAVEFSGAGVETPVYFLKLDDSINLDDFRDYETHFNVPPIAMKWASYSTNSDAAGAFNLGMVNGKYVVFIEANETLGSLAHWGVFEVTGDTDLGTIELKEMKTLSGNVANAEKYDMVTIMAHSLNAGMPYRATPDQNGDYTLEVAPGTYYVRCQAIAHDDLNDETYVYMVFYEDAYLVDDATPVDVQDDVTGIDFTLPVPDVAPFSVSGTVTSANSGLPLENADVRFVSYNILSNVLKIYEAKTDAKGEYKVEGLTILPEDSLVGIAWKDSTFFAKFYDGKSTYQSADPIVYHANEDVTGIDFALDSIDASTSYSISGSVTDEAGNKVQQGQITAFTNAGIVSTQIDTNGNYDFGPVFPAGSTVYLQAWGGYEYLPSIYNDAESWEDADALTMDTDMTGIDFVLKEKGPARLPIATIKGALGLGGGALAKTSEDSGYESALVYVKPAGSDQAWTNVDYVDENGNFNLGVDSDGKYDLKITAKGYEDYVSSTPIEVENLSADIGTINLKPTSIDDRDFDPVIRSSMLHDAYPNPFNPSTTIKIELAKTQDASLVIYNVIGQKVRTLHTGLLSEGVSTYKWNGTDDSGHQVASGLYFYQLKTKDMVETKAVMFLK